MNYDLEALREIQCYNQCPYCYEDITDNNIIGEQEYDICRIGHNIGGLANIFECPYCFEKSFGHKEVL